MDGQLLAGATAAAAIGVTVGPVFGLYTLPVALVCGGVAGAAWAWIAAVLRTQFHVLEVISTIMLNFIATYGVSYLVRGPLQEPTHIYPQTATIAMEAQLPQINRWNTITRWFCVGAWVSRLFIWWLFRATAVLDFVCVLLGRILHAAHSAGLIDVHSCDDHGRSSS